MGETPEFVYRISTQNSFTESAPKKNGMSCKRMGLLLVEKLISLLLVFTSANSIRFPSPISLDDFLTTFMVKSTLENFFKGREDLYLLQIDFKKVIFLTVLLILLKIH
ncbi:hypothetical protein C5167_016068 [Papaver somniferum]|nr:hypothetical protein C5167_016068 [Papaver somniferum]